MSRHEPSPVSPSDTAVQFAEGIRHAESGYRNAQDVIRFIDTKAGAIAGFTSVCIGVVLQGIKEFLCLNKDIQESIVVAFKQHPACALVLFGFCVASIGLGIACIWFVVQCVAARSPRIGLQARHSMLFPYYDAAQEAGAARVHYQKLERGLTRQEIAEEYEVQLLNVGAILEKKILFQRRAANAFLGQLTLIAVSGAILFFYAYIYMILPEVIK